MTNTIAKSETKILSGAQIFLEALREEGVDEIFGYPGGVVLSVYDALYECDFIKHYLVRHEQAAIHAAEGYARVTGKPGVAVVTSGPGATNTITGIANAYYDGYPLVVFTGQVASNLIGNDAFQEADIVGITRSCCKHNYLVKNTADITRVVKEAFHIATTGKPGPVVVDLPKDVLINKAPYVYPKEINLPGYNPNYVGHPRQILKALGMLQKAERPVILAGGGVVTSEAAKELTELAKSLNVPVTNTLMGLGSFPQSEPLSLGMLGMHGNYWANHAVMNADVLFAIGTRFSDRITGNLKKFCSDAEIIHVDIDPCSISKSVRVDVPIVGDAKLVLNDMIHALKANTHNHQADFDKKNDWLAQIREWRLKVVRPPAKSEKLSPQTVITKIHEMTKDMNRIITTEVGQHQMWSAQLFQFEKTRQFVTSGGLGTMGFGFPAAMGAQIGNKDALVIDIAGDGSFQMNIQELATCVQYNLPVKVAVINNGYLGMVRQWQEKMFDKHYSQSLISGPDFVKVAEAYGAVGIRVEREEDVEYALKRAFEINGPVVLDFIVEPFEVVYPWVLVGDPINKVLLGDN